MTDTTIFLENCLGRLKKGDMYARDELVARVSRRLMSLAERMLQDYPRVARWEQSEDVFQQAAIRLHRALGQVVPSTVEEFLRLSALQLRRELRDMARHYFGPGGLGANHDSIDVNDSQLASAAHNHGLSDSSSNPQLLALWTEFHSSIECLPEDERNAFDLLWYHELSQTEAADVLNVSERQLRRYWQSARLRLQRQLGDSGQLC